MKTSLLTMVILILGLSSIISQGDNNNANYTKSEETYFTQKPPGLTPEIFAPGIISTKEFEFGGTFSADGKEYYFTRRPTYEGSKNRIYFTTN